MGDEGEFVLYPGDILNLEAYTITRVGDEGGVVYRNTLAFHSPPQR